MSKFLKRRVSKVVVVSSVLVFLMALPVFAAFWNLTGWREAHDPSIIKEGSTWWDFYTGTGLKVAYSADGKAWNQGVPIFANPLPWWKTYAPNMTTNDV